ncbi:riboflavin synthase [[Candida] railenensis]|uniref:Riboflavin synthase n=1 Tax=[Candida] railenensis TaxID=45579 RepID=A0A9P0QNJ1_9ASCO|nr:riboflavin synthase [[Candida] railenensis]
MFTGLIEHIGTVSDYSPLDSSESGGGGVSITIADCAPILVDVHLGDSISVNGVCLTVTEFDSEKTHFKVGVAPETLRRTNLGDLKNGSPVNLERAVTSDVRLGGHVVQGHVDTIANITKKVPDGNAITFTFQLRDTQYITYIVEKGFISIDGTSLTVTDVNYSTNEFSIMLISYSQGKVILAKKALGDSVNIEVDLTGKLIEKQIEISLESQIATEGSALVKLIEKIIDKKLESYKLK